MASTQPNCLRPMPNSIQRKTLRVLIIEDSQDDALLTLLELEGGNFDVVSERVETESGMRHALNDQWDLIISDFNLPQFDALTAMSILRESDPNTPFIVVSGCIGEESVVDLMKAGANDFVMKDKLSRLLIVVERELQEADIKRAHRKALDALRDNEILLREITNTLGEGVLVVNDRGTLEFINPEAERLLGWSAEELSGKNTFEMIYPNYSGSSMFAMSDKSLLEKLAEGVVFRADDELFLRKDGSPMPVSFVMTPIINDGKAVASVTAFQDISMRKKAELELLDSRKQLRELSAYLQSVREDERTRIARELHDELGQMLTGVKLKANSLIGQLPKDSPVLQNKANSMCKLIDETMDAMRRTASDLRPVMLDDLGLMAAIEWLTEDFTERTGLNVQLELSQDGVEQTTDLTDILSCDDDLNAEVATAAFRIVQESLTNIARHAEAANVKITIVCQDGDILLRVSDDGKGIEEAAEIKRGSFGVIGMRERAYALGGTLKFSSKVGLGTTVEAVIPINPVANNGAYND